MASAAGFQLVTMPVDVVAMIASLTWVAIAAWQRSAASAAFWADRSRKIT